MLALFDMTQLTVPHVGKWGQSMQEGQRMVVKSLIHKIMRFPLDSGGDFRFLLPLWERGAIHCCVFSVEGEHCV